jgi:uncharacterized protein YggE
MNISTTVAAKGQAEAPHNLAHFHLVLKDEGATVPSAKARLKKQVETLNIALSDMKVEIGLKFVKNSFRTNSNVQQKWEYNQKTRENDFRGFEASYTVSFTIDDLDKVSEIYDALTNLDKVQVSHPWFSLKTLDRLNKKALKRAFDNVQLRFEEECTVMGLTASDFEVGTWEVNYSDSQRSESVGANARRSAMGGGRPAAVAAMAMGGEIESASGPLGDADGEDTLLEINPGNATVTVNLEVGYIRRAAVPVKASVVSQGHSTQANATV